MFGSGIPRSPRRDGAPAAVRPRSEHWVRRATAETWDPGSHGCGKISVVRLEDLPLSHRILVRSYPWRRIEPVPRATPRRPLALARVALVSTAGLVPPTAEPFDLRRRGGDPTFRVIDSTVPFGQLTIHHRSQDFDRTALQTDPNVAFPLAILENLARGGRIGGVAPRHLSFMGSITATSRLVRDECPRAAAVLVADEVDIVLLVPV